MIEFNVKLLADYINKGVKSLLADEKYKSIPKPHIIIIQVGEDPISNLCVDSKRKACEEVGIKFSLYKYKDSVTTEHLKEVITKLSLLPTVTAISIQTPLPDHIDERALIDEIDPNKDIEGVTLTQAGMLQLGVKNKYRLIPYAASAILKVLYQIEDLSCKNITVIGSDNYIGKAVTALLQENDICVASCPSNSKMIEKYTHNSDIIILTSGNPKYFKCRYLYGSDKKIIIDASLNIDKNGNICGDLDFESLNELYTSSNFMYTSVPGGVDIVILAEMLNNICIAYDNQFDFIWKYCENLSISSKGIITEPPKNIIKLDIDDSHPTLIWDGYSQNVCKTQVVDKVDLTKINVIVFPEHIKTVSMSFVEGFIKLFPIDKKDFYKYFEIEANMPLKYKFINTIEFKLNIQD